MTRFFFAFVNSNQQQTNTGEIEFAANHYFASLAIVLFFIILTTDSLLVTCGYANDVDLSKRSFRFGFSRRMFSGVNENDAVAAIRIWAAAMSENLNIPVDPKPLIFRSVPDIDAAIRQKRVELICVLAEEYFHVKSLFPNDKTLCGVKSDSCKESYCLLTNKKNHYSTIKDLCGKSLGLSKEQGATLGEIWLDTYLYKSGLNESSSYFKKLNTTTRIDKLIYQLFFQQIDACLASRNVFEIMAQLNPQIGNDLKIIVSSPPLIPVVFAFRGESHHPQIDQTFTALSHLHESPAGAQLMTLFKIKRLKVESAGILDTTLEVLETYNKINKGKPVTIH